MPDTPITDEPQTLAAATATQAGPLSHHAEDVLAEAIGHDIEMDSDENTPSLKTVKQVLSDMKDDKDELAITLEYGTGESGVDQASWNIEVTSLQRAYMRKQSHEAVDALSKQIDDEIRVVLACVDAEWLERTLEFRAMMKLFEQSSVSRQQIDDYQHRIFGRDAYLQYLEAVLTVRDEAKLLNAAGNLQQITQQLETDYDALIDPSKVDNGALADAIIAVEGDIDILATELERDYSSAVFRRNLALADKFVSIVNENFLKDYKLWAHSFDLNMREVLATERSVTNGPISDKSREQLKDMLLAGADQINSVLQAMQP